MFHSRSLCREKLRYCWKRSLGWHTKFYILLQYTSIHITWHFMDHSWYGPSQWETTLHYNIVSHWLSPYPVWSRYWRPHQPRCHIIVLLLTIHMYLTCAFRLCSVNDQLISVTLNWYNVKTITHYCPVDHNIICVTEPLWLINISILSIQLIFVNNICRREWRITARPFA